MQTKNIFKNAGADDSDDPTPLPVPQKKVVKKDVDKVDEAAQKVFVPKITQQQRANLKSDGYQVQEEDNKKKERPKTAGPRGGLEGGGRSSRRERPSTRGGDQNADENGRGGGRGRGRGRGRGQGDRPDRPKNGACFNCGQEGHLARDCPDPKKESSEPNTAPPKRDRKPRAPAQKTCYKCNQTGHIAKDCPEERLDVCYQCNQPGHIAKDCPEKEPGENQPAREPREPRQPRGARGGDRGGARGGDRGGARGGDRGVARGGDRGGARGGDRGGARGGDRDRTRGGDRGGARGGDRDRKKDYEPRGGDRDRKKDYEESKTADAAEYEEVILGESLDDFLKTRVTKDKKEARAPEGIKGSKVQAADVGRKNEQAHTMAQRSTGPAVKTGGSELVGFTVGNDDAEDDRGGKGRGARDSRGPKDKGPRPEKKTLTKYSDKDFPQLGE